MQRGTVPSLNQADPRLQIKQLADALGDPIFGVKISAADEAANARRFSFQVCNRQRYDIKGRYVVRVWFSSTEYGGPTSGLTLAIATGTLSQTITANQYLEVITSSAGLIEIDATIVGAATRYAHAVVVGEIEASAAVAWV